MGEGRYEVAPAKGRPASANRRANVVKVDEEGEHMNHDRGEPESVTIDSEAERRELEAAGWERIEERSGRLFGAAYERRPVPSGSSHSAAQNVLV